MCGFFTPASYGFDTAAGNGDNPVLKGDGITFGLAFLAYVLLSLDLLTHLRGRPQRILTILLAVVLVAHVSCVWGLRFDFSFETALSKGIVALVVFHVTFFMIVAAAAVPEPWSGRLILGAWPVVTLAAVPAPLKYEEISILLIPMIVTAGGTAVLAFLIWRGKRRAAAS